jgi:hypothetical protein
MPRFVLLYHVCPPDYQRASHWDLMLESGETLRTWALAELPRDWHLAQLRTAALYPDCPPTATGNAVDAEQLGNHRSAYLDYEGPASGDRGQVTRIDGGTYIVERELPDEWQLELVGSLLRGKIVLQQTAPVAARWMLNCQQES